MCVLFLTYLDILNTTSKMQTLFLTFVLSRSRIISVTGIQCLSIGVGNIKKAQKNAANKGIWGVAGFFYHSLSFY